MEHCAAWWVYQEGYQGGQYSLLFLSPTGFYRGLCTFLSLLLPVAHPMFDTILLFSTIREAPLCAELSFLSQPWAQGRLFLPFLHNRE